MAIVFKSFDSSYCIVTNFKVMYSTLKQQSHLSVQRDIDIESIFNYTGRKYLLARNPYDRLESFYRDKFILHPGHAVFSEKNEWQHCQKIFFNEYNFKKHAFEEVRNALITTSFEQFITMLPSKYMLDGHLIPQVFSLYFRDGEVVTKIDFDKILQIEDVQNMLFLESDLKINTSIRENETKSGNVSIVWNETSREIVNTLYRLDFEQLGYNMIDDN